MSPKNAVEILQQNYSHCIIKTYKLNIQHNSINMSKIRSLSQLVSVKKKLRKKAKLVFREAIDILHTKLSTIDIIAKVRQFDSHEIRK